MGPGRRSLPLNAVVQRFLDRPAEVVLALATLVAVAALAAGLPALLRDRRAARSRITSALVILTGGAGITFVAYLAFVLRCGDPGCQDRTGEGFWEMDRWWRAESTWQWGGQLLLAALGLVAASIAFALSARQSRFRRPALIAAWALYVAWALVAFVGPAAYELAT